jgi:hypothetical protein
VLSSLYINSTAKVGSIIIKICVTSQKQNVNTIHLFIYAISQSTVTRIERIMWAVVRSSLNVKGVPFVSLDFHHYIIRLTDLSKSNYKNNRSVGAKQDFAKTRIGARYVSRYKNVRFGRY